MRKTENRDFQYSKSTEKEYRESEIKRYQKPKYTGTVST